MICEKFASEGSNIVVNYVSSKDRADEVAVKCKGFGVKTAVVQAVRKQLLGKPIRVSSDIVCRTLELSKTRSDW